MQPKPPRPTGVTILAILAILLGIVLLLGGIGSFALAGLLTSIDLATAFAGTPLEGWDAATLQTLFYAFGAIFLVLGILYLAVGGGFWGGKRWAWTLGMILGVIIVVLNIVQIVINPASAASNIVGLIIPLIILFYLTRTNVKAFFGKGSSVPPAVAPPS